MAKSFEEILVAMADTAQPVTADVIYRLSELNADDLKVLQARWGGIPVERRLLLVQRFTEAAETNFDLNFGAATRLALTDLNDEVREAAVEFTPGTVGRGAFGIAEVSRQAVQIDLEHLDLPALRLEIGSPEASRLAIEVPIDGPQPIVEVLARHAHGQGQVRLSPQIAAEGSRKIVERLPGGVHRPLQVGVSLIGHHPLTGTVHREDREGRIAGEGNQKHRVGQEDLCRNSEPHGIDASMPGEPGAEPCSTLRRLRHVALGPSNAQPRRGSKQRRRVTDRSPSTRRTRRPDD